MKEEFKAWKSLAVAFAWIATGVTLHMAASVLEKVKKKRRSLLPRPRLFCTLHRTLLKESRTPGKRKPRM